MEPRPNHFNKRGVYHTFFSLSLLSFALQVEPSTTLIKEGLLKHTSPFHLFLTPHMSVETPTTLIKEGSIIHSSLSHFCLMHYMWNPGGAPTTLIKEGSIIHSSLFHFYLKQATCGTPNHNNKRGVSHTYFYLPLLNGVYVYKLLSFLLYMYNCMYVLPYPLLSFNMFKCMYVLI